LTSGEPRTVSFRVLRSSWGIAVDLTARATRGSAPEDAFRVGERTWLRCSESVLEDDVAFLRRGLARVAAEVDAAGDGEHVVVDVLRVDYVPTDYQADAMEPLIAMWAAEEFGFNAPAVTVDFVPAANRYVFAY